ncbi:hypothetical protein FTUN_3068 [Frigoriglobus tundricola]|uniref:Uncharacterized protein n=1 Tax=Frigoriglobus tundricola TaxID=2774151 RepID=A0A6M5YN29_9BACT|nr:hypothetical protein FTUN_3068 [Frigoriglobus tundricola]
MPRGPGPSPIGKRGERHKSSVKMAYFRRGACLRPRNAVN